jgi:predicted nuclease of predicted toxin-antitoxin system
MPRFLLDANLSQKVGRYLTEHLQIDVISLQGMRQGQLPDHQVVQMAHAQRRVVITLDRDFANRFERGERPVIGVVFLDLPAALRTTPHINRRLAQFFEDDAEIASVENSLVTITESDVRVLHG